MTQTSKHVLGISGGKDSAALAVYMRQYYPEVDIEYFFTDTGKELPEVYEFLNRLEGFLGKEIIRLNPDRDFDYWLLQYNNFLPSPQTRWCTRQLKLRPFEAWLAPELDAGVKVFSYVAIRADEQFRQGYSSKSTNLEIILPFKDDGIDKKGVLEILENSGVGLPDYYRWRSRSGCTFCFFQQKIEWVRLAREHPKAIQEAIKYEQEALESGSPFTWSQGESLKELLKPKRVVEIEREHQRRKKRVQLRKNMNPLRLHSSSFDLDEIEDNSKGCLICHK